MMLNTYKKNKYEGFSLVEMLITIVIMGVIMIISSLVLTTLIRVSIVASDKIRARNESEYVLELLRRTVRNSDPSDVYIFDSTRRDYDPRSHAMVTGDLKEADYTVTVGENEKGNEIQFRPYGYSDWICLGFFKEPVQGGDREKGYLLWTSGTDLIGNHRSCFNISTPDPSDPPDPYNYLMVLNSKYINITSFEISYIVSQDGNYIITFDIGSEPINWYLGGGAPINKKVFRQTVVSTEGVEW